MPKIKTKSQALNFRICVSLGLMLWSLTYWGDRGYGDESLIPMGYGKKVSYHNSNTSITPKEYSYVSLHIGAFQQQEDLLFGASVSSSVDEPLPFFFWNIKTEQLLFFKTFEALKTFLKTQQINEISLKSFHQNYRAHWHIRLLLMA